MKTSWHVATAAEAIAAAQFARCGWDISIQYGANQPEYDLVAVDGDRVLKVSVKGTQSDGWGLTQGKLKNADCHGAVDRWLETHSRRTVFCLVQFKNVMLTELPRIYLATSIEIASHLKRVRDGHGYTILHEDHKWSRGIAQDSHDRIPDDWRFTPERLEAVAATIASQPELARC